MRLISTYLLRPTRLAFGRRSVGRKSKTQRACYGLLLVVVFCAGTAAQDTASHRELDGNEVGIDVRARDELLSRLSLLSGGFELPSSNHSNPGRSTRIPPDVQRKLNQQVQQALRSLPSDARQPIADLIRRRLQSTGAGSRPQPGAGASTAAPALSEQDIERILSDPSVTTPRPSPTSIGTTPESPADRQARIDELRETLRRIGSEIVPGSTAGTSTGNNPAGQNPRPAALPDSEDSPAASSGQPSTPPAIAPPASRNGGGATPRQPEPTPDPARPTSDSEPESRPEVRPAEPAPNEDVWQKLDRIVHVARSSNETQTSARSAFARAIEETATDWSVRAEEFIAEKTQTSEQDETEGGLLERVGEATNSANNWAVEMATETSERRPGSGARWPSGGRMLFAATLFLLIAAAGVAVYRYRNFFFTGHQAETGVPTAPQFFKDRRDVVRAFHFLAASFPELLHDWWTHGRAAKAIADGNPSQRDAIHTLARLYEAARYMPEEANFSEQQLDSARQAFRRLQLS